jgi:hypothetical protein
MIYLEHWAMTLPFFNYRPPVTLADPVFSGLSVHRSLSESGLSYLNPLADCP